MIAWHIIPPHPNPEKRRVLTRRVRGVDVAFWRVRVERVDTVDGSLLRTLALAEVRTDCGGRRWCRFDRLASDRSRFFDRWTALAGIEPGSGVAEMPAGPGDRSTDPTGEPVQRSNR